MKPLMTARHWTDSYGPIPHEINPDRYRCVTELLEEAMHDYATQPAFHSMGETTSYGQINNQATALAAYLQKVVGVNKGDRVAVMLPNIVAFPISLIALAKLGVIQVNINPLYTAHELLAQLNDSGAETIIVFTGSTPTLAEVMDRTRLKSVIVAAPGMTKGDDLLGLALDAQLKQATSLAGAIRLGAGLDLAPTEINGDDLMLLQYTGGTTGLSKGAALSHRNLIANIEQLKAFMPDTLRPGKEVVITAIPLYHIFALMVNFLTYFSVGAQNWLVANARDMNSFIDVLKEARPTVITGVNTLYAGLASHPRSIEVDWSRLRLSLGGGAAVFASTSRRWESITGNFIREGYGLSETSPVISFNPQCVSEFTGSTGLPVPSTAVKLIDDQEREAPFGAAGEICVKGPQVMRGYWNKPQANATAFTADGYFRTGDIGVFDEKGFLRIVDRKKDMVIVSGFNVYPNEVEAVVTAHPDITECACVGVPDERTGEAIKLFVVKAIDAHIDEDAVMNYCRSKLVGYKVPKVVRFIDALPKSTVGKVLRRELRLVD
jgi:long-chain acyl-CoA synthetase